MAALSKGEKWIRLLRAYGPVADNEGQQAEHVDKLATYLGVPKVAFVHPTRADLLACFPRDTGAFRNVVLTGTAGEGKTSLCFELIHALTDRAPSGIQGVEVIAVPTPAGPLVVTLIFDVTAWRKKTNGLLLPEYVALLARMADSSFASSDEYFVLAVNDGQMHELFRALPPDAPEPVKRLERTLITLHARGERDGGERLRLINLSAVASEEIMALSLQAVLDRPEWACFQEETSNPLFAESSSLTRNFRAISLPETRAKLIILARIADVTGHHLPIRGVLCLLANALLGHPDARDRVIRPGAEAGKLAAKGEPEKAALHRMLFGENLSSAARRKREIYRFLSMLHIGDETTNDLDELLIFGTKDGGLKDGYDELVGPDPFHQRNPAFDGLLRRYIRGDATTPEEGEEFLAELATERRRVFLQATPALVEKYQLWKTTIFHHAGEYLDEILRPIDQNQKLGRIYLRKLASGLNRIWTGLLLAENANEVYLAKGLDLTTAPVSDIYIAQIEIDADPAGLEVVRRPNERTPRLVLRLNDKEFSFSLTLPRFEFLFRVADGAMPSSFSRESCADFLSLKQRCLRDLALKASERSLHLIEINGNGTIQRLPIHLAE
jgi:hypothetical protein